MSDVKLYVVTKRIAGRKEGGAVGDQIELTPAQAVHPLFKGRVRVSDANPKLEVATPAEDGPKRGRPSATKQD